ncbi:hypothetical protein [Paracidovorax konjaci]|uniref:hypothetical protein n=1 Tax=Paracidovorax konjaci TaxID=32040 RepID=UPI001113C5E7|nr:hypothetical protein [Paracidovorax konjaci]
MGVPVCFCWRVDSDCSTRGSSRAPDVQPPYPPIQASTAQDWHCRFEALAVLAVQYTKHVPQIFRNDAKKIE